MNCLPPLIIRSLSLVGLPMALAVQLLPSAAGAAASLNYSVTWVGNSFPGASNKWVQNFFIHTKVQPDGTVNTWSHWDEGGKKFRRLQRRRLPLPAWSAPWSHHLT